MPDTSSAHVPPSATATSVPAHVDIWPRVPLAEWQDTCATLHLWTQIVGKTRLAFAPMENHWWQAALYVTPRGLTTSSIPYGTGTFRVDFDFIDHVLTMRTSDATERAMPLIARSVADFHREYLATLRALGVVVHLWPMPVEIAGAIPFPEDNIHASYDADAAHRFWRALVQADRVLKQFRGRFIGKASPVHFFWGSFDLAATRFSGRRAPAYEGSVPNVANRVMREAYSHEEISAGFWPGGGAVSDAAFYAYAYPEPSGLSAAAIQPEGAYYHPDMREFILPYEIVRTAPSPDETLLAFLQSTYDAAADLARWDRPALERGPADGS